MFNLSKEVNRLHQLRHDKVHGLPYKPKIYDSKVKHIDGDMFEIAAEQEGCIMLQGFYNRSKDFGRRLSKRKGERHHPGGGHAACTITIRGKQ